MHLSKVISPLGTPGACPGGPGVRGGTPRFALWVKELIA